MTRLTILFAAFCSACVRPPSPLPEPSPARVALAALGSGANEAGGIRMIYGRTSCQWDGPNPVVLLPARVPQVGRECVVRWQMSAVPPPVQIVDQDGVSRRPLVALLASTRSLDTPLPSGPAAPGCFLLVHPDLFFTPADSGFLTYDGSFVTLRFEPGIGTAGSDLYAQLVVGMPGANPLGLISSAAIHLHIGG